MRKHTLIACLLAGALLAGCGTPSSTADFGPGIAQNAGATSAFKVVVPPGGGSVTLPPTQALSGVLNFAPGASADTVLTLSVSETPPPGADSTNGPGAAGFYYVLLQVNRPFNFALLNSLTVTDLNARPKAQDGLARAIANDAELYEAELDTYSGGSANYLEAIQGRYDSASSQAVFSQPDTRTLEPGTTYLYQAKAIQEETIPVTVVNNSGIEPAYLCILGQNPNAVREGKPDPDFYRVSADGKMVPFDKSDRNSGIQTDPVTGVSTGFTDLYNIPIKGGTTRLDLPQMYAGRMFISLGRKMQIGVNDNPPQNPPLPSPQPPVVLAQPNGWTNPADPNYKTLFDWLEFDYKINGDTRQPGIGINKTEVDMMGFGVQFTLEGPTIGSKTVGTTDLGRAQILNAIMADSFFKNLIVPGPAKGKREDGTEFDLPADIPLRAVAPVKGLENQQLNRPLPQFQTFDLTYFDQYLTDVWSRYRSQDLKCYTSAFGTWYGRVDPNDRMVFTCVDDSGAPKDGFDKIYVRKPSTTNAFEPTELITSGGITYQPTPGGDFVRVPQPGPADKVPGPNDDAKLFTKFAAGEIVSALSAAMNRTTLLHEPLITRDYRSHSADLKTFYKKDATTSRINVYAKAIHDNSLVTPQAPGSPTSNGGGAAYAFGFDDNSNQSSFLSELTKPTAIKIVITKLK